jgi:replication factor A1
LPDEPELHIVDVPINNQAASSSSKVASPLDPTTPTPVPPSKTNANFLQQPQVSPKQPCMVGPFPSQAKRQLLFEDETLIQR